MINKKGFSLIELLVVITIIGVLAALLIPIAARTREGGRIAQCMNNLRQIGIAICLFADDNDLKLLFESVKTNVVTVVAGPPWSEFLEPYIDDDNVYRCPSYKAHDGETTDFFSYGYNYSGLTVPNPDPGYSGSGIHIDLIQNQPHVIMVVDGSFANRPERSNAFIYNAPPYRLLYGRHAGGVNILFVDGHVSWHRVSDIPLGSDPDASIWWNY